MEKPENPYTELVLDSYEYGPARFMHLGSKEPNILVTQQDTASAMRLSSFIDEAEKPGLFKRLEKERFDVLGRILCGVAAGLTCLQGIGVDGGIDKLPNATSTPWMLLEICKAHSLPAVNPETGESLPKGWLAFAHTDDPEGVKKWEIYHHALAYGLAKVTIGKPLGEVKTMGIRGFTLDQLMPAINKGAKVIISVDNRIVTAKQRGGMDKKLEPGTHLVALTRVDESDKWWMVGDPYHEWVLGRSDHIPQWKQGGQLEAYLNDEISLRRGIVVVSAGSDAMDQIQDITYPLAVPNI